MPIDTLVLDEYDEMPAGTLALAKHRLDSSTAPMTRILSTPTYPGTGIDVEYLAGDQRRFFIPCPRCGTEQPLDWEKNVEERDGRLLRVCVGCRESLEATIAAAWVEEGLGKWRATNPGAPHHSYHVGQLYRPTVDLAAVDAALRSSNATTAQEAWNQHLGLPYSPAGGQLSVAELQRRCIAPFTFAEVAGIRDCYMGVDVGSRLHAWIEHASDRWTGEAERYLVAALELDSFEQLDEVMRRFGVTTCVVDANPEFHGARQFQQRWWGQVYLADYVHGRLPVLVNRDEVADPKRMFRVQVDRTGAMDAITTSIRDGLVTFPADAGSVPGLFAHLQAPVRQLRPDAQGNPRGVYDEGSRPDHYYHAARGARSAAFCR